MPYTAGWNMPGYLPETDPLTFDTFRDASEYLLDTVTRFWDEDVILDDESDTSLIVGNRWMPICDELAIVYALQRAGYTTKFDSYYSLNGDESLAFWITKDSE